MFKIWNLIQFMCESKSWNYFARCCRQGIMLGGNFRKS